MANEPTLTCSEVVERLQLECIDDYGQTFDRTKAEKILHSWRERRVQELEEALAKHSISLNSADSASGSTSHEISRGSRRKQ